MTAIKRRPVMGVRQFRDSFPTLTESVEVIRATGKMERLGIWTPEKKANPDAFDSARNSAEKT